MRRSTSGAWVFALVLGFGCGGERDVVPTAPGLVPSLGKNAGPSITVVALPTLGGGGDAYAINDAGTAVGYSLPASGPGYSFAVRWTESNGRWTVTQIGGRGTKAAAINSGGTIAGDSAYAPVGDAIVWWPGGAREVVGPGEANGINDAGVVVGTRSGLGFHSPAAWRKVGGVWAVTILENAPGTVAICPQQVSNAQANSISDAGIIVGFLYSQDCSRHYAVKWVPKVNPEDGWEPAEILQGASGMVRSYAYGIEGNAIVGVAWPCAMLEGCLRRAYRWSLTPGSSDTGPIGSLDARANGVNAAGASVGSYLDPQRMRAVMWNPSGGAYVTLPALTQSKAHWVWDINNPTPSRSARLAVGGAGGPVLWTIP